MFLTVTLNPALDKLVTTEELLVGEANRIVLRSVLPAGKGVDVAKVLREMNGDVCATGFLGGTVEAVFDAFLAQRNIRNAFVSIAGETRTNIQVFDGSRRTELLERGPDISQGEWEALLERITSLLPESRVVTICGSAPPGVDSHQFRRLIRLVKSSGAATIVDASGALLRAAIEEKPHVIKPNRTEMLELMGQESADEKAIGQYAAQLVRNGIAYVLVSLGKDGALLVCKEGAYRADAPDVPVKSTLGCGDMMVASMALSLQQGLSPQRMLCHAIALSSANAMNFETAHILISDYEDLLKRCPVTRVNWESGC